MKVAVKYAIKFRCNDCGFQSEQEFLIGERVRKKPYRFNNQQQYPPVVIEEPDQSFYCGDEKITCNLCGSVDMTDVGRRPLPLREEA